jgi:hypothetical protein
MIPSPSGQADGLANDLTGEAFSPELRVSVHGEQVGNARPGIFGSGLVGSKPQARARHDSTSCGLRHEGHDLSGPQAGQEPPLPDGIVS